VGHRGLVYKGLGAMNPCDLSIYLKNMDGRYIDLVVVGRTVLEHIMHKWAEKMNE
jgi:hypothetical protein